MYYAALARLARDETLRPEAMYEHALALTGLAELADDFTLVHVRLRTGNA